MITFAEMSRLSKQAALDRLITDRYQGDTDKFASDISSSLNQLLQSDLKKAAKYVERAEKCFALLPKSQAPRLLAMQARLAHWSGKSANAVRKYENAIRQFEKQKQYQLAAQTQQGLMDAFMYLGKHPQALDCGKAALKYFRKKHLDTQAARVMTNIGNVYHRLDRNREALSYYDLARAIFAKQGGISLAIVDFNRANILVNFNRLDEAEQLYRDAAEIYRQGGMAIAQAKAEYSLAYLYFLKDQYTLALATFDKSLVSFKKLGDAKAVAVTTLDLAEISTYLNQLSSTVMYGQDADAACKKLNLFYEEGKAAYFIAEALRHFGDNDEAARYLNKAKKLFGSEKNQLWLGMVELERARFELDAGKIKTATRTATAARRLFQISGDERRTLDAEITLIEAGLANGSAESAQQKAKSLLNRPLSSYQQYRLEFLLGKCLQQQSRSALALRHFRKAIAVVEKVLPNLPADERRFFFALGKSSGYSSAVECLLELGKTDESFAQNSRALAILNQRRVPDSQIAREVPQQFLRERDRLRLSLKRLQQAPGESATRTISAPAMRKIEHQLYTSERRIASILTAASSLQTMPSGRVAGANNLVDGSHILINPVALEDSVGVFSVTNDSIDFVRCRVTPNQLNAAVRQLHFLMENAVYMPTGGSREAIIQHLNQLRDWLLAPIEQYIADRKPVFLVDGIFAQIPFAALPDSGQAYLKDSAEMRIIVSPDDLAYKSQATEPITTLRSAIFAPSASGLPMVEIEGSRISAAFPEAMLYTDDAVSSHRLLDELRHSTGFVHIATHASRSSENPLFSRILLNDGPFFPFDLFGSGVAAQLVTLSGCQTAAPGIHYANSFSLAKAFYQAGARFVLASLWTVSDKLSMMFMTEFYQSLSANNDVPAAYAAAINHVMKINDNPAFWAPYVLLGI